MFLIATNLVVLSLSMRTQLEANDIDEIFACRRNGTREKKRTAEEKKKTNVRFLKNEDRLSAGSNHLLNRSQLTHETKK